MFDGVIKPFYQSPMTPISTTVSNESWDNAFTDEKWVSSLEYYGIPYSLLLKEEDEPTNYQPSVERFGDIMLGNANSPAFQSNWTVSTEGLIDWIREKFAKFIEWLKGIFSKVTEEADKLDSEATEKMEEIAKEAPAKVEKIDKDLKQAAQVIKKESDDIIASYVKAQGEQGFTKGEANKYLAEKIKEYGVNITSSIDPALKRLLDRHFKTNKQKQVLKPLEVTSIVNLTVALCGGGVVNIINHTIKDLKDKEKIYKELNTCCRYISKEAIYTINKSINSYMTDLADDAVLLNHAFKYFEGLTKGLQSGNIDAFVDLPKELWDGYLKLKQRKEKGQDVSIRVDYSKIPKVTNDDEAIKFLEGFVNSFTVFTYTFKTVKDYNGIFKPLKPVGEKLKRINTKLFAKALDNYANGNKENAEKAKKVQAKVNIGMSVVMSIMRRFAEVEKMLMNQLSSYRKMLRFMKNIGFDFMSTDAYKFDVHHGFKKQKTIEI